MISATIHWMLTDPYNSTRPETFIVSYGVTSGQLNRNTPGVTANQTSQTYFAQLNSLQPGTKYFYRIESRNVFESIYTDQSSFRTDDASEERSIHNLNVVVIILLCLESSEVTALEANSSSGTLFITWRPPANPNGRILNYSVSIINLSDGSILRQEKTLNTSVNQRDLGNHVVAILILFMIFLSQSLESHTM